MKLLLLLLSVILFLACNNIIVDHMEPNHNYEENISNSISKISQENVDSSKLIIDKYIIDMRILSCYYCVVEGDVFNPLKVYFERKPNNFPVLIDHYLKEEMRLRFAIQRLFSILYKETYQKLLIDVGIDYNNMDLNEEFNSKLTIEAIIEEYFKLN